MYIKKIPKEMQKKKIYKFSFQNSYKKLTVERNFKIAFPMLTCMISLRLETKTVDSP